MNANERNEMWWQSLSPHAKTEAIDSVGPLCQSMIDSLDACDIPTVTAVMRVQLMTSTLREFLDGKRTERDAAG